MALFAFGSGYFFTPKWETGAPAEFGRKLAHDFTRLLLPAYAWNLIYGVWTQLLRHGIGLQFGSPLSLGTLLVEPILHNHQFGWNLAAWFVYPLFAIRGLYLLADRFLLRKKHGRPLLAAISAALGLAAYWMSAAGWTEGRYAVLVRILYLQVFFMGGILYRALLEKHDTCPSALYFAVILGIQWCILMLCQHLPSYEIVWGRFAQEPFPIPYIEGFLGIALWLRISRLLAPVLKQSRLVMEIANNTYSIMLHQFLAFFAVNTLMAAARQLFGLFDAFDTAQYLSDIYYRYAIGGLVQSMMLYLAAGLLLPLLIARAQRWVLRSLRRRFAK